MSEFDYVVEWIKGIDNHTPDQLSRLINIPDSAWTPLDDGHAVDDDSVHPFLHIACAGNQPGDKFLTPGLRNCMENAVAKGPILNSVEDREWAPVEHRLNCANGSDIHSGSYNVNWSDAKVQAVHSTKHEEHLHYAMPQYKPDNKLLKFTADDYLSCPEFQVVYGMLLKQTSHIATCFAVLRNGTNTEATDSELFSDSVATQVLSENPELNKKLVDDITDSATELPKAVVDAAIEEQSKKLLPPSLDFWSKEEKAALSLYRVCFIENGYLYRVIDGRELLCVPDITRNQENVRYSLFEQFHDVPMAGHRGVVQTYSAMRRRVYWKCMDRDIRKYVGACTCCQMNKKSRRAPTGKRASMQIPHAPMESYNIDFLTDLPPATDLKYDMAMVVLDRFSQRLFIIPTWKKATGAMVAEQFHDEITCREVRGVPRELIADRDIRFTSNSKLKSTFFEAFQRRLGTCTRFTSARTQSSNGAVERQIAVVIEVLMCYLNYEQTNWIAILPHLIFAINNSPSKALQGKSPIYAETGINPRMPVDLQSALDRPDVSTDDASVEVRARRLKDLRVSLRDSIKRAREDVMKYANKGRRDIDKRLTTPGAKVWLSLDGIALPAFNLRTHAKWNPLWYGPFVVLRRPSENSFTLKLPPDVKIHDTFHVSSLKPFEEGDFKNPQKNRQLPAELTKDPSYEISRILDDDWKFGEQFYLVGFKGYSEVYDNEWFRRSSLMKDAAKLVLAYEKAKHITVDQPVSKTVRRRKSRR